MTDEYFDALLKRGLEESLRRELLGLYDGEPDTSALDRRMEKLLLSPAAYAKKAARPWYQKALRAAAMFLLVCSVLVGLSALNPQVRAKYSDLIKTLFTDHNTYKIESDVQTIFPQKVKLGYIPEGYELETEIFDSFGVFIVYRNDSGDYFSVSFDGKDAAIHVDNEHSEKNSITINGNIVDVYESSDAKYASRLVVYDYRNEFILLVEGFISIEELITVVESIEY